MSYINKVNVAFDNWAENREEAGDELLFTSVDEKKQMILKLRKDSTNDNFILCVVRAMNPGEDFPPDLQRLDLEALLVKIFMECSEQLDAGRIKFIDAVFLPTQSYGGLLRARYVSDFNSNEEDE